MGFSISFDFFRLHFQIKEQFLFFLILTKTDHLCGLFFYLPSVVIAVTYLTVIRHWSSYKLFYITCFNKNLTSLRTFQMKIIKVFITISISSINFAYPLVSPWSRSSQFEQLNLLYIVCVSNIDIESTEQRPLAPINANEKVKGKHFITQLHQRCQRVYRL